MILDVGTLAFSTAVLALAVAAGMSFVDGKSADKRLRHFFSASAALYGLGVLWIIFWPKSPLALTSGNALVLTSACAAHAGLRLYVGKPMTPWLYAVLAAILGAGFAVSFQLTEWDVNTRIVVTSLVRVPLFVHGAAMLGNSRFIRLRNSSRMFQTTLWFFTVLLLIRIADVMYLRRHIPAFVDTIGYQAAYFMGTAAGFVCLGISVTLMTGENERIALRQTILAQTRDLRIAKSQAENALENKSRFLAATGHDLRQAVHALSLLLAAVDHELSDRPEEKEDLVGLARDMSRVTASMTAQLNALLEIARLDSGIVIPVIADARLSAIFVQLNGQFGPIAQDNGVDLRFIESSLTVRTDPQMLASVLGNLIDNAIKFGTGGRVVVGCRRRGAGFATIQVWDEGIGIAAQDMAGIFREYRQLDNPGRVRSKGLGLGLAIARRKALLLGASIKASSVAGGGSVFAVEPLETVV